MSFIYMNHFAPDFMRKGPFWGHVSWALEERGFILCTLRLISIRRPHNGPLCPKTWEEVWGGGGTQYQIQLVHYYCRTLVYTRQRTEERVFQRLRSDKFPNLHANASGRPLLRRLTHTRALSRPRRLLFSSPKMRSWSFVEIWVDVTPAYLRENTWGFQQPQLARNVSSSEWN